jgi:hypothetical protein
VSYVLICLIERAGMDGFLFVCEQRDERIAQSWTFAAFDEMAPAAVEAASIRDDGSVPHCGGYEPFSVALFLVGIGVPGFVLMGDRSVVVGAPHGECYVVQDRVDVCNPTGLDT